MDAEQLTIAQAAERHGISDRTVRRWIKAGHLTPEIRRGPRGREYRLDADQVAAVVNERQAVLDSSRDRTHPLDAVQVELAALRLSIERLTDENRDLRAQVHQLTERVLAALPEPKRRRLWPFGRRER